MHVKVKVTRTWYTPNIWLWEPHQRQFTTFNFPARNPPKPTQLWCEYYLVWAITSWWWDQVPALHPIQSWHHHVIQHRAGTNFRPWYGEAVTYRNTAQCFHPLPGIKPSSPALDANHYIMELTTCMNIYKNLWYSFIV